MQTDTRPVSDTLANTIPDTCRRLGIKNTTAYKLIKDGKLHAVKLGGRTVVLEAELQRFVLSLAQQVAA